MNLLIGLIFSVINFLFQIRPRIYNRYFGVDTWRNLSIADYIRDHKRLPDFLPKYMIRGPYDYPPFICILLALFPKKFIEDYQGFISPFIDSIHNFFVFIVSYLLTAGDIRISILVQLIHILTPSVVMENSSLTARGLGSFMFSLSFLSIIFYSVYNSFPLLIAAIFFTVILLFTQKMAVQTLFFLCIFFSLIEFNILYIGIFLISVLLAIIVSGGFYLRVLKGQLAVLKYFRIIINDRYAHQVRGNTPVLQSRDFVSKVNSMIGRYPILALVSANPFMFIAFIIGIVSLFNPGLGFGTVPDLRSEARRIGTVPLFLFTNKFILWIMTLYILGLATAQIKPLQFLGEGVKYLTYGVFPAAFIISLSVFSCSNNLFSLFVILTMAGCLLQILILQNNAIIKDSMRTVTPGLRNIMNYLQNTQGEVRLATMPFSLSDTVAYFTKCNILSSDSGYVLGNSKDYLDYYPVIKKPLDEIFEKYKINYLLINENYVKVEELPLREKNVVLKEEQFYLLKTKYD